MLASVVVREVVVREVVLLMAGRESGDGAAECIFV